MTLQIDPENIDLVKDVGYDIDSVERKGTNIVIKITTPDETRGQRVHRYGLDHAEQVEYIKDGQVHKVPKALKKIRSRVERELRELESISSKDLSEYNVLNGEEKVIETCKELR